MRENYSMIVSRAREAFNKHITKSLDFRVNQLEALLLMFEEHEDDLVGAIRTDIKKPHIEALLTEVESVKHMIKNALCDINQWVRPTPAKRNLMLILDEAFVLPQPYGVVLIIGCWNFPLLLTINPFIGAIAAGNCVIIKPSEKAPATGKILEELFTKYLDQDCFHIINGGVEDGKELLMEKYDYIFYTGSALGGRNVRQASNKYLTPVTLELGGKSPVYIDDETDFKLAARRVMSGKMLNLGQTCVAPDYVLCSKAVEDAFIKEAKMVINEFFGENPKLSPDLARIINDQHFEHVVKFLNNGQIAMGGEYDASELYIAPTILIDVTDSDFVMQEEIFGPILPIINVNSPEEAIEFINKREKPLTLYLFTTNRGIMNKFMTSTCSGGMCINDTVIQLSVDSLPFGGVGTSGMGRYFGKYTFDTFSHQRAVLIRSNNILGGYIEKIRYPPLTKTKLKILKNIIRKRSNIIPPFFWYIVVLLAGMLSAILIKDVVVPTFDFSHKTL